jgi:hypothetical protein
VHILFYAAVFTINFLTYQPGGLVPMEFLQVPLEFTSPPYQDNFVQGLDERLKLIGSVIKRKNCKN